MTRRLILERSRLAVAAVCWLGLATAQTRAVEDGQAYEHVIAARADTIVATLSLDDEAVRVAVQAALVDFSRSVNAWHEENNARRQELTRASDGSGQAALETMEAELASIRQAFLGRLEAVLPPEAVAKVKDGLTYNVVHVTERAYHDLLPDLTADERERIHTWLVEARDLAISEGSSEAKHGVFGRFKGRINNFLSQAGYDLKRAERDWHTRRKAAARSEPQESK